MIINYIHKFLYIHIQKTAGTSITSALNTLNNTKKVFYQHSLLKHVILNSDQEQLFKFAFVRNPWDRIYSWYNMSIHKGPVNKFHSYTLTNSNSFFEFLNCQEIIDNYPEEQELDIPNYKSIAFNQLDYLSDANGRINVDFIGRFENIEEDFKYVCNKLGLGNLQLKQENKFSHANYRKQYNDEMIDKVYQLYQRDIEYFKYEF